MHRRSVRASQKRSQSPSSANRKRQHTKSLSQPVLEQHTQSQEVNENFQQLVNNCVRYVIYRAGNNLPIRKADLQKHVLHNVGRNFDRIITEVSNVLKDTYGYDLYLTDDSSNVKQYLVSNLLPYTPGFESTNNEVDEDTNRVPDDVNKILIMLVLTHVFMSNDNVNEASLFSFLRSIQIDPDEKHTLFGNVKEFVTSTMVKQKYLQTQVDPVSRRVSYMWGARAEHEISKRALLKFVCKMYKDIAPKSWSNQFTIAEAQAKDREVTCNGNVDEDNNSIL